MKTLFACSIIAALAWLVDSLAAADSGTTAELQRIEEARTARIAEARTPVDALNAKFKAALEKCSSDAQSPTPTSRYRSLKTRLGILLRELCFIHHYVATGD